MNECQGCWFPTNFCLIKKYKMDNICPCAECIVKPMCKLILSCDKRDTVLDILKDQLK
jgi:hypothetical protein